MRSILKYIDEALFSSASEFSKADDTDELEFVDLGLSVNWAKCNLGAEKETDSGNYYMWGSTKPNDNDNCCWETVPFNNGRKNFDKDYFNSVKNKVCPNGILASEYDAAYKESNGNYRMPTTEEFDELINNTNHEWIINYEGTKVNGMKFINKTDDDSFIFIPAVGCRLRSSTKYIDTSASVWSVSLGSGDEDYSRALFLSISNINIYNNTRDLGFSVRPVQDK